MDITVPFDVAIGGMLLFILACNKNHMFLRLCTWTPRKGTKYVLYAWHEIKKKVANIPRTVRLLYWIRVCQNPLVERDEK